jgi:oligopeptide/dipeptide ABC transporter ATP-binding protein|tara:strand:- start:1541 stop:2515 length:975 start_codon:yes stop_codon:yes gene_type:complete
MNSQNINLIEISNLKKYFPIKGGLFNKKIGDVKAVEKINFTIKKGDVLGLVGESGSGKTTLGRSILRLIEPSEGKIIFENIDITSLSEKEMRKFRKDMQIIFQDPFASLDPRKRVLNIIGQGLKIHTNLKKNEIKETVLNLLEQVDLQAEHLTRYPHEFSGGQRQRIGIARAIALKPKFIVADEPVSALDVSIQAQILNLLQDLKKQYLLTMLFISHDLSVVKYVADKVMVMYLGKVVEITDADKLYSSPLHPYTISLLEITPTINPKHKRSRNILKGDIPSPINPPSGCVFRTRCPKADSECAKIVPELRELKDNHFVACIKK